MVMNKKLRVLFNEKGNVIHSISKDASIVEAVGVLNEFHIGALIVLDEEGHIEGIVTERDILKLLGTTNETVGHLLVKQIMTPKKELIIGNGDDTIEHIMSIMRDNNIRHIPIVDENSVLKGVLSMRDIIRILLADSKNKIRDLNDYIMGKYPA